MTGDLVPTVDRVRVGRVAELPEGSQTTVQVGEQSVLVIHDRGRFYALHNVCTHQSFPLAGGPVEDGKVTCTRHGAKFDLETGKARTLPAVKAVRLFRTEVDGEEVYVAPLSLPWQTTSSGPERLVETDPYPTSTTGMNP